MMSNRICYQVFKPEMEFHMIYMIYAALPMHAQTEKTTFSCKDDCTLMKHTRRWTYSASRYFWYFICLFAFSQSIYHDEFVTLYLSYYLFSHCIYCISSVILHLSYCTFHIRYQESKDVFIVYKFGSKSNNFN